MHTHAKYKVNTIENLTSQSETQWEPISIKMKEKKKKEKTPNTQNIKQQLSGKKNYDVTDTF